MRYLIAILALAITTGCETEKSGAEISALGEKLVSTADTTEEITDGTNPNLPFIDTSSHAANFYSNAVSTCQSEGRKLCTKAQMDRAFQETRVVYSYGNPQRYWTQEYIINLNTRRNVFVATTAGSSYEFADESYTRKFYCCEE